MKILTTIVVSLLALTVNAQAIRDRDALYQILRTNNVDNPAYFGPARKLFMEYLAANPASIYKPMATFYLAEVINKLNKPDSAMLYYKQTLTAQVPDSIENAHYKHLAAQRLAEMYITAKEYKIALQYIGLSEKTFTVRFECGNARMDDYFDTKVLYAKCYIGKAEYTRAIDSLTPFMFDAWMIGNKTLIPLLYTTYRQLYTSEEIKKELSGLEKKIIIIKETIGSHTFQRPRIKLFNHEIDIEGYNLDLRNMTAQQQLQTCIDAVKRSQFYKLAINDNENNGPATTAAFH